MAENISYWKRLSQDPLSCVKVVHNSLHLALSPALLTDVRQGVKKVLDEKVAQFDPKYGLEGLLVAYSNVKVTSSSGTILIDKPSIHLDIAGEFYVFAPKEGITLKGILNKKSTGHLGCLVHKLFNASIPKPPNVNPDTWIGSKFELGDEICFIITRVNLKAPPLPDIYGELDPNCKVPERVVPPPEIERSMSDSGISTCEGNENTVEVPKEKKKKKKVKEAAQPTPEAEVLQDAKTASPTKKTKKMASKLELPPPVISAAPPQPTTEPIATLEGSGKKKKAKKQKKLEEIPNLATPQSPKTTQPLNAKLEEIRQRLLEGMKARLSPARSSTSESENAKTPAATTPAATTPKSSKKTKNHVKASNDAAGLAEQLKNKLIQDLRLSFVEDKEADQTSPARTPSAKKRKHVDSSSVLPAPKSKKSKLDVKSQIKTEKVSGESEMGTEEDEGHNSFVKELLAKYCQISSTPSTKTVKKEKQTQV